MLLRTMRKGFVRLMPLFLLLLCMGCGKIGNPVPPEHLQPTLNKDAPKQSSDMNKDINDACSAEDSCKKTTVNGFEVKIKD